LAKKKEGALRALATNRAASHEYHLSDRTEAGIVLAGTEVKSARAGKVNLKESWARIENGEAWLEGAHISPYSHGNRENHDPLRPRKLLLHAGEIRKLAKETASSGVTLVPTKMYVKNGRIKIEIAVGRGKKLHDKREASRQRDMDREIERATGRR
jgi:SsrA-binding protein